jgi:hypothetical protein
LSTQFNQVIASAVLDQLSTDGTQDVKTLGEAKKTIRGYFRSDKGHSGHGCGLRMMCSTVAFGPELSDLFPELRPPSAGLGEGT